MTQRASLSLRLWGQFYTHTHTLYICTTSRKFYKNPKYSSHPPPTPSPSSPPAISFFLLFPEALTIHKTSVFLSPPFLLLLLVYLISVPSSLTNESMLFCSVLYFLKKRCINLFLENKWVRVGGRAEEGERLQQTPCWDRAQERSPSELKPRVHS